MGGSRRAAARRIDDHLRSASVARASRATNASFPFPARVDAPYLVARGARDRRPLPGPTADGPPAALFSCDLTGTVLAVGPALGELSGRPSPGPGIPADSLLDRSSLPELHEALRVAGTGSASGSASLRLLRAGGFSIEVRASWSVLAGDAPDTTQVVFLTADPSARPAFRPGLRVEEAIELLSREGAVVTDAHGRLLYASPTLATMLGYGTADDLPTDVGGLLHPDDVPTARAGIRAVADGRGARWATIRLRAATGDWRWVELAAVSLDDDALGGVVSVVHDITAEVEAKQALRASEARFVALTDLSEEGICVVGPTGGTLYENARMASLLGGPLPHASFVELMSSLDLGRAVGRLGRPRTVPEQAMERYEVAYPHPDGRELRLRVAATPLSGEDGTDLGTLLMVADATGVRRAEQALRTAGLQDSLTRLPNRTLLVERLAHALEAAAGPTAALLIGLDHFRMVNNSRGHAVGDELLSAVGARLGAAVPFPALVGRFGADEFAVVCENGDEDRARSVAQDLLHVLAEPFVVDGVPVRLSASIGVAVTPRGCGVGANDLLRRADTAMQAAKHSGRGQVRVFDRALGEAVDGHCALAAELQTALTDDTLRLEYQPVVAVASGAVVGVEALVRWTRPEGGPVLPTTLVSVAEATGLAPRLDRWVLRRALGDMTALRAAGAVPPDAFVGVNLSAHSLDDPSVVEELLALTAEAGLPASQVVLEITETALLRHTDSSAELLRRLRDHGFRIALDDFGTGYSSLAYLRDLPISALKIDRSFVADMADHQDTLAIVASIVDLARAVDVAVVAEGVETAEQAALLEGLGVPTAQGWLWSPAVPVTEAMSGGRLTRPLARTGGPAGTR
jgi:diguanylate cyclase (GGDEF)-like protein/PAS domain S-box-containing protein